VILWPPGLEPRRECACLGRGGGFDRAGPGNRKGGRASNARGTWYLMHAVRRNIVTVALKSRWGGCKENAYEMRESESVEDAESRSRVDCLYGFLETGS